MSNFEQFLKGVEAEKLNEKSCPTPYNYENVTNKNAKRALKDIDDNRNHSWAIEMYDRNVNSMDEVALYYRGVKVTYKQMFEEAFVYAKSLKQMGFKKGDEVPICITNTPEFVYLFLAVSFIGACVNVVGSWFDKDYLTEILNKTNSDTIFIDDISYDKIKDSITSSNIKNIVCFSLVDTLKKGMSIYYGEDHRFHRVKYNVDKIKEDYNGSIFNREEFCNEGKKYTGNVIENVSLDDVCSITYTSGTTSKGRPKGVIQSNRSYITLSRFKESDVLGVPTMKNMSVLAHIPTYTHMELSCAISDTLYCSCTLALEPFYVKENFLYSLVRNKPNFVPASVGFWTYLCKLLNFDQTWKNLDMPYLAIPTVTGEACSSGEEKFFNYTSRKHKFGIDKLPFPLAPATFSIGGGTTESSGIFVTLFKALQEKKLKHLIKKETLGLTPHKFAEVEVLDDSLKYCDVNVPGLLVANSPCEMIGYTDEELNKTTHVIDAYGHRWLSLGTYSYKDTTNRIKMKGRMNSNLYLSDGAIIPYYFIEDVILLDTKNVMSCSVINTKNNELVCHIELQPYMKKSMNGTIIGIIERINNNFNDKVKEKLYFRFRDGIDSFPLDPSGKRSITTLMNIGIDEQTMSFDELQNKYFKKESSKVFVKK